MAFVLLWSLVMPLQRAPDVEGLWEYESIGRAGGGEVPIAGPFLFCDGYTVQNSLNVGEPFDRQLAQAHFGTYRVAGRDLVLISTIGLVVDPTKDPPLDSRRNAEHHVTAERTGDRLTLTFGTGTVQRFKRVAACGPGQLVLLQEGALALVDGRFVIVAESGAHALAGSGTYERAGRRLTLHADRWFSLQSGRPTYTPPTVFEASFDGRELRLPGQSPLHVKDREPKMNKQHVVSSKSWLYLFALVACAIAITGVSGQERVIAIRAAWLVDATGRPPIPNAVVVVRGNTIDAVGARETVPVPAGADVIDLENQTLLPGMIDTHSHLVLRYGSGGPAGVLGLLAQKEAPDNEQMLKIVRDARVQLLCGITTLRQVGEAHYNDILLRDAITSGMHVGPRIISSGEAITNTGGHGSGEVGIDGEDAIRRQVRKNFHHGAQWIKLLQIDVTPTAGQMAPSEIKAAVDEAHRLGMKVTIHATGRWGSAMKTAIEAGVDNIEHARPLTDEMVALMLKHGTTASLTPLVYIGVKPTPTTWQMLDTGVKSGEEWIQYLAKEFADYRKAHPDQETKDRPYEDNEPGREGRDIFQAVKTVQREYLHAFKAGLPFSLGLDTKYGGIPLEMEFLVEAGIPPIDAIRAGTAVSAKLIGYGDKLGTIEKGKWADMISVQGNPIEDITNMRRVRFIMKDGVRFDTLSWR